MLPPALRHGSSKRLRRAISYFGERYTMVQELSDRLKELQSRVAEALEHL